MQNSKNILKNIFISIEILAAASIISIFLQELLDVSEHFTSIYIFAVFLISLVTDGYIYGIISAVLSMLLVNYAFRFPFFALNFTIPSNLISAIIMIIIAVLTSMLTTKIKLHEAEKAEGEKERMRANLLRAVSHDLRTPLTTICGSASTLIERRQTLSEEQQIQILNGIREDSDWLIRMVENLLSITRISSGDVKVLKTPTVLDELIDSVLCKFKARYPKQEVILEIPRDIVLIPMDAMLIEQVLLNLLYNAMQHAKNMTMVELSVFTMGNQAIFEVKDDGCGIDENHLQDIFSGYHEEQEAPYDGKKYNSGIGLSVCATIISAHGGEISAENRKIGGALFRFCLSMEEQDNGQ